MIDALADGTLSPNVASMKDYLLNGDGGYADPYLCLKDFASYAQTHEEMERLYSDRSRWMSKAIINVARSYYFSSDRSIKEYNEKIWQLTAL